MTGPIGPQEDDRLPRALPAPRRAPLPRHLSRHRLPRAGTRRAPLRPPGLTRGRRRRAAGRSPRTTPRPAAGSPGCRSAGPPAPGSCPSAGRRAVPGSCCPAAGLRGGAAALSGRAGSARGGAGSGHRAGLSPGSAAAALTPRPGSEGLPAARGSGQRGAPGSRSRRPGRCRRGAARSEGSKVCGASGGAAVPGRREGAGGGRAAGSARLPWGFGAPCAPPPPAAPRPRGAAALCAPGPCSAAPGRGHVPLTASPGPSQPPAAAPRARPAVVRSESRRALPWEFGRSGAAGEQSSCLDLLGLDGTACAALVSSCKWPRKSISENECYSSTSRKSAT